MRDLDRLKNFEDVCGHVMSRNCSNAFVVSIVLEIDVYSCVPW